MIRKIFKKLGLTRGSKSHGSTSRWRLEVERQNSDRHSSSSGIGTGVIKLFQQIKDNIGEDKILTLGYKHLLSLACEHLNFDAAAAFVIDHDDNFGLKGYVNLDIDLQEKYFIANSGMMIDLFNKDIPKFITDIDLLPANCRGLFKDFKAVWLIPLLPQGMAAGVLVFGHKEIPQHREDYYPKLDFVTIAAGWFFENHHKERLIDRENKKNLMLVNTSLAISSSLDLDEVCHVLVSNLGRSFGCSYSYVMLSKDGQLDMFVQTSFSERGGTVFLPGERFINIGSMAWLNDLITMGSPVLLEASEIDLLPKRDKEILKINGSVKVLIAPLKHASKLTGLLLMVEQRSAERTRLDNEVVDLCAALVAQAAAAIENARLYSLISDRVAQITTMFEVGQALNTDLDLIPFFERVLKAISNNFRIMTCSFFLKDFDTDELYLASVVGHFPGEVFGRRLKIGKEGITGHAAATGHIINVGDVKKDSRFVESTGRTASELAVPVILNGSVVGVLDIESEQNYAFTQREEDLLKSLVDQVAVAIEKIKLKQLEKERSNKLALTNSMLKKLSGVQDQAQLLSEAVKGLTEGFGFDLAAIFIPEGNGAIKLAQQSCRWGEGFEPGLKLLPNEGLPGKVSILKASCHLNQINPAELNVGLKGIKSRYCLPLLAGNILHGVLDIQDRRTQAFSPIDISTIQTFAEFISIALNNIQLYRETIDKAERLSLVDQINQAISITLNLEELFGKIVQSLSEITGYQWAALVFKKGPGYYVRSSYLRGNRSIGGEFIVPGLDSMDKHFNDIYAGGPPQYCNINEMQISKDLYDFYHQQGINFVAVCPIKQKGLIQGILIVGSPNPEGFSYQDRILLHDVSMHLEIALNNAILYGEIKEAYDRLHEAQEKLIQSEKFKALGEVAAGIAHDFKNILAAIMGRAQLLSMKIQQSESLPIELVAKGLEVIDKAATDGVNILSRITEFSKNKNKNNFVQITLNEVLDDTIEMIRPKWDDPQKQKEIKISTNYFEPLPIWGDRSEMVEVFSNLIINAVDAIKKTGEISISGYGEGENAVIKISDSGVGIDHETIKRIFDPFFSTKGRQGTGLGLTMVYAIIERHGGEISVESIIGQGTTFTIRLPQYSSEQEGQKSGIVVVGDNQSLQNELRQFLNKSGFRAFSGQRIDEILKIIRLNKIDMIAIDAGLALEDLREMIKRIREHSSALPIVLMVEDEAMLSEDHYAGFGTIATVKKPLDAGQILRMLNKFEDGKSNVSYFA